MKQKGKCLWMEVTLDEYELPVAVADTATQLSRMRGHCSHKVTDDYYKYTHGKMDRCRYRKVEIDEEEE